MTADDRGARLQLVTAAVILGTFLLGLASGVGLTRLLGPPHPPPPPYGPPPADPLDALDLSPEQRARADAIRERHRPAIEAVLREGFPRMRALHEQMRAELREILTPEQRRRLDELDARRPPPRPGGPGLPPPGLGPFPGPPPFPPPAPSP
ncbi:MAG: periplasmic heavy metal sensor [Polyangiaceae bacterium]|nr:periplasmic heavy metal sensor [Polyangiaceae bacterium]